MNAFKKTLITIAMFAPLAAAASTADDVARIRALLPVDHDIAQLQDQLMRGSSEADAFEQIKPNYIIRDINGDGLPDVLVISEENPQIVSGSTVYGKRSLMFFVGQKDGSVKLSFANDKMIMGADEGGTFGDPLNGLTLRKNGTITSNVYGGSAWRWAYTDTMQFRHGDLYIIGLDSYAGWTGDLRSDTVSQDLLTGQVIKTHAKNGDSPEHVKKYRVPVKPLIKVADYPGDIN
jgi:hypothetical protein